MAIYLLTPGQLRAQMWLNEAQKLTFSDTKSIIIVHTVLSVINTQQSKIQSTSQPKYLRQLISESVLWFINDNDITFIYPSGYSRHHAPERHMVVVLIVQLYRPSGTIYQPQSSKRTVCLFFVTDSRHICLL